MSFLGSLLFNITLYSSLPFISAVILVAYPFVSAKILSKIASFWISFILKLLRFLCSLDWGVKGLSNIPNSPVIVISNHQGQWESLYLQTLIHPISSIIKEELLWIPFFGWALFLMNPIAIKRSRPASAIRYVLKQGSKRLNAGNNIVIYPEGTRVADGTLGEFKTSGAALAIQANAPVLPVSHNSGAHWKPRRFMIKSGTIEMQIGPAIQPEGLSARDITEKARAWIATSLKKTA